MLSFPKHQDFAMKPEKVYATKVLFGSSTKTGRYGLPDYDSIDLHLTGPVAEVKLKAEKNTDNPNLVGLDFEGRFIGCFMFRPDWDYWKESSVRYIENGTTFLALRIASFPKDDRSLLLMAVDKEKDIYERVGIFRSEGFRGSGNIFKGDEPAKSVTII